ncbi:hypothetical protein B484DRAFT_447778 [Ochromonadaceae sp. CCMP2298]|nr:hypothetical protein B484DRAFT_447778 [Ochromonadaceae sp. CCMP2298]
MKSRAWKDGGDASFDQNQFGEALSCYETALTSLGVDSVHVTLLSNLSQCYLNLQDYGRALLFAFVAITIGKKTGAPTSLLTKAHVRITKALLALKRREAAAYYSLELKNLDKATWAKEPSLRCLICCLNAREATVHVLAEVSKVLRGVFEAINFDDPPRRDEPQVEPEEAEVEAEALYRLTCKAEGNDMFLKQQWGAAAELYISGLGHGNRSEEMADLLRDLSDCYVLSPRNDPKVPKDPVLGATCALAACTLRATPLGLNRLVNALAGADCVDEAASLCAIIESIFGTSSVRPGLKQGINQLKAW